MKISRTQLAEIKRMGVDARPVWQQERGERAGNQRKQLAELKVRNRRINRAVNTRELRNMVTDMFIEQHEFNDDFGHETDDSYSDYLKFQEDALAAGLQDALDSSDFYFPEDDVDFDDGLADFDEYSYGVM